MKPLGQTLLKLLAVALIALSGGGFFVGAHHAQAGVEMVICAGDKLEVITIGADGQPIAPSQAECPHCPSCLPTPIATLASSVPVVAAPHGWLLTSVVQTGRKIAPQHWMAPIARGPPLHSLDDRSLTQPVAILPRGPAHRAQPMGRLV